MSGMQKVVFVAKHSFTATREDEVTLRVGDVVECVQECSSLFESVRERV